MIDRYWLKEMKEIWRPQAKLARWIKVEMAAAEVQARHGIIPGHVPAKLRESVENIDLDRLVACQREKEAEVNHDVIAFLMCLEEAMGSEARWLHFGMTSYDVVDTANGLALKQASALILQAIEALLDKLYQLAHQHKHTPIMGRTHGVFAEPTSFGLKILGFWTELFRARNSFERVSQQVAVGKLSGTVGNASVLGHRVEEEVMQELGLGLEPVSTQVVCRDRHARFLGEMAVVAGSLERLATEIRALARTEVQELSEPFGKSQRGSSAMPHKRNPIVCERICGMARLMRGYALAGFENANLWHERDISNSSVERVILPDATGTLYYMLVKMQEVIQGLVVNRERMAKNISDFGDFYRSQLLLLALVKAGASRARAYAWVKEVSQKAFEQGIGLAQAATEHPDILNFLTKEQIKTALEHDYLKEVDKLFERASRMLQSPKNAQLPG